MNMNGWSAVESRIKDEWVNSTGGGEKKYILIDKERCDKKRMKQRGITGQLKESWQIEEWASGEVDEASGNVLDRTIPSSAIPSPYNIKAGNISEPSDKYQLIHWCTLLLPITALKS